jgi:hypothetical protein
MYFVTSLIFKSYSNRNGSKYFAPVIFFDVCYNKLKRLQSPFETMCVRVQISAATRLSNENTKHRSPENFGKWIKKHKAGSGSVALMYKEPSAHENAPGHEVSMSDRLHRGARTSSQFRNTDTL